MPSRAAFHRPLLALAGLAGAAGVALAARASHDADANLTIAGNFMLLHATALIGISLLRTNRLALAAGYVLVFAVALFAGDLALRSFYGHALFPFAAPVGGGGLILGWLLLAVAAFVGDRPAP